MVLLAVAFGQVADVYRHTPRSGNAITDFFFADVGITQNQFNIGQQLLSLGIVLLEVGRTLHRAHHHHPLI